MHCTNSLQEGYRHDAGKLEAGDAMSINFDKALGIHEQALLLRARRNEVLAVNIANADTPNFKARDLDFRAALAAAGSGEGDLAMARTQGAHVNAGGSRGVSPLEAQLKYRLPNQPTLDGNTVESHIEQTAFAENALDYQASLQFLGGKFATLKSAITGGR